MGFRVGAYATCWSVEQGQGNFSKVRLSISRKNKEGVYEQDFSGFCTFIGTAHAMADKIHEKDRIKLGDVDVSTTYDKAKNKEYVNYKVFSFEFADSGNSSPSQQQSRTEVPSPAPFEGETSEDELPF
jgi:hypothetical protein